jgi:16S rRNA processing protein RimM
MHTLADEDLAWPEDAVEVARIVDAWGIKGGLKVVPYASKPEALFSSKRWFLQPSERQALPKAGAATPMPRVLRIVTAKVQGDSVVATAREVPDRNAAEALKGARVFVSRASFPTADEGEYYWIDLLGLDVVNRDGEPLGKVVDLLDTGAHSVLRLALDVDGKNVERLIPFVKAYIDQVDLPGRRVVADWGLDY